MKFSDAGSAPAEVVDRFIDRLDYIAVDATSEAGWADLKAALGRVKAKMTVMALSSDIFFPPADVKDDADLVPGAKFEVIETSFGHAGLFAIEPSYAQQVDKALRALLD